MEFSLLHFYKNEENTDSFFQTSKKQFYDKAFIFSLEIFFILIN